MFLITNIFQENVYYHLLVGSRIFNEKPVYFVNFRVNGFR